MTEISCELCGRAMLASAERCACGANVDWLRRAPAALRAKLGRGVMGVVVGTVTTACTSGACAASIDAACSSDCGLDAFRMPDASVGPILDGASGDCGLDAYRMPDANVGPILDGASGDCAVTPPDMGIDADVPDTDVADAPDAP